jgi:uracil-DNA glycosylase
MEWEKFRNYFHESWHNKMKPFIESEECDKIYKYLKSESQRGKKIAPLSSNVYRCFYETPLTEVKVVILGMCPYHTFKNDTPVADGLLMGCSVLNQLQPSLSQFYNAIERELYNGVCLDANKPADVIHLTAQGVLMMNAALTTEKDKAGSHLEIWEPFTSYVFKEIISTLGVPVIYLGKEASKFERYAAPLTWHFPISHPASASYRNGDWDSEGAFKAVSKIIKQNNNYEIDWLDTCPF